MLVQLLQFLTSSKLGKAGAIGLGLLGLVFMAQDWIHLPAWPHFMGGLTQIVLAAIAYSIAVTSKKTKDIVVGVAAENHIAAGTTSEVPAVQMALTKVRETGSLQLDSDPEDPPPNGKSK